MAYAIAWDFDHENPNPHPLTVFVDRFTTVNEAVAEAEKYVADKDDDCFETPRCIVCIDGEELS